MLDTLPQFQLTAPANTRLTCRHYNLTMPVVTPDKKGDIPRNPYNSRKTKNYASDSRKVETIEAINQIYHINNTAPIIITHKHDPIVSTTDDGVSLNLTNTTENRTKCHGEYDGQQY